MIPLADRRGFLCLSGMWAEGHLDDFLQANAGIPFATLLEADESQIARYVDGLLSE